MSMLCGTFDAYGITARLAPALITLLPAIVTVAVWTPVLYDFAVDIVATGVTCAFTVPMAHWARYLGRNAERQLFQKWGGKPTSLWLLRSDSNIHELTKARYRRYLEENVDGWKAPSQSEEEADRQGAISTYDSAVQRLKEGSRDRRDRPHFDLVFKENVSYGFRRNTYGLRWIGRFIAVLCVAVNGGSLYFSACVRGDPVSILGSGSLLFSLVMTIFWLGVNQRWVRDAANGYARALLAVCDSGPLG